jgi:release factor glutamine methyltransferase
LRGRVDLVVANPPYVGDAEFAGLDPVLRYEPHGALVAESARGVEGFADLDVVIREAYEWLSPTGVLVCEHGEAQRRAVLELATSAGFRFVEDHNDLVGRPRVLVARR